MCILWRDILLFFLVSTVKVFFIFIRNALVKSSINNVFFKANIKMLIIFFLLSVQIGSINGFVYLLRGWLFFFL